MSKAAGVVVELYEVLGDHCQSWRALSTNVHTSRHLVENRETMKIKGSTYAYVRTLVHVYAYVHILFYAHALLRIHT